MKTKQPPFVWFVAITAMILVCVISYFFTFGTVKIAGNAMLTTFTEGEKIFYYKRNRLFAENGDIIVFKAPDKTIRISRIIAKAGQTVDIDYDNDTVSVDGVALSENYIYEKDMQSVGDITFPYTVPHGYFVMGDNRNISFDSRFAENGCVNYTQVLGRYGVFNW
ncbi:MAG: signal peptidase I [Clostridiales bacterium]|jgi:signal peptidase I|nr:signal peptidase I [Clostridiales bacterium]